MRYTNLDLFAGEEKVYKFGTVSQLKDAVHFKQISLIVDMYNIVYTHVHRYIHIFKRSNRRIKVYESVLLTNLE